MARKARQNGFTVKSYRTSAGYLRWDFAFANGNGCRIERHPEDAGEFRIAYVDRTWHSGPAARFNQVPLMLFSMFDYRHSTERFSTAGQAFRYARSFC